MSQIIIRSVTGGPPAALTWFTVPDDGHQYGIVKHDFETEDWRNPDTGEYRSRSLVLGKGDGSVTYPDTFQLGAGEFLPLTSPWQFRWFDMMKAISYYTLTAEEYLQSWRVITQTGRALTDRHSWDWNYAGEPRLYEDFVQPLNAGSENGPMCEKTLTMGGNLVRIVGSDLANYYDIETLDVKQSPPSVDTLLKSPWLLHWGTQTTKEKRVINWSWLKNRRTGIDYGVPFFLLGKGGRNTIKKSWVKLVAGGTRFSPYA